MRSLSLLALLALCLAAAGHARGDDRVIIDVDTKSQKGLYPIAIPLPVDSDRQLAELVTDVQRFDLSVSSWFKVLDPRSFLANLEREGLGIEPEHWKAVGAFGVIKARVVSQGDKVSMKFKLYEIEKGAVPVLERDYIGPRSEARYLAHQWSNEVVKYYTGEPGFFETQLSFVVEKGPARKAVMVMDFDGHALRELSHNRSINVLPAWHPSGKQIAFTSYMRKNPDLYLKTLPDARPKRVSRYPGMNTGAAFSPSGRTMAITLSKDGNAEIYLLDARNGRIKRRLTENRYIDTSPAFSPDGSEIAFVSDREGGPQIFVMNADGSNQRRVSTVGNYNQTPEWCPMKGRRLLAYTARDDVSNRMDIVTLDLDTKEMRRITQNQGWNEEPTWSPNCRVIAFAVDRRKSGRGIYLANADGTGQQVRVYSGKAHSPAWGPMK